MKTPVCFRDIKLFLFDLDGTLYLGDTLFDFTIKLLNAIKQNGGQYLFMTNNSSKSVNDYVDKLNRMGVPAVYEDFITSSQATVHYLKKHHPDKRLYVCGTQSLKKEFCDAGFAVTDRVDETDCIVMGFDTELTFQKLHDISYMLSTREIPYVATNPDYVCPTSFGSVPDCGSVCDMLYNATGKRPIVIGKPEPLMPQLAMEKWGCAPQETAVIGDRIYTDIRSGINAGTYSVLVMSGETTQEILDASEVKPDIVLPSAESILETLI